MRKVSGSKFHYLYNSVIEMIRAIIVDDEQHCVDRLSGLISTFCNDEIHIMEAFNTVEDGLKGIEKLKPNLVFLDVQIGEQTGFDLLNQLDKVEFETIFTTAHEKYAVQAFKFCAIDYLLKPIDLEDLQQSLTKLQANFVANFQNKRIENLLSNINTSVKRICVPVLSGFVYVKVQDIIRCQSDVNYTTLFMINKQTLMVAKTLKEFDELLSDYSFFRVHNSHLVNLQYIKSYNKGKGGFVILEDGSEIEVSSRRKDEFLKSLKNT